jgi:uncharacterized membrane protein YtjA (UPF0391 family)
MVLKKFGTIISMAPCIINITFKKYLMLRWALIFLVVAIIAGLFGFTGISAGAAGIAKVLFFIFVVLLVLTLIFGAKLFDKK